MRRFRTLNRLYAFLAGYFWIPCPWCETMFGGHEIGGTLWVGANGFGGASGKCLCWKCDRDRYAAGYLGPRFSRDDVVGASSSAAGREGNE